MDGTFYGETMSGPRRFFVDGVSDVTTVSGEEYNHAVNTLRLRVGDEIILCDNTEKEYLASITQVDKKSFSAKIIEQRISECECKNFVTLICGYLKGDKTELVVQKAVELGVKKIVVFSSKFCSAYINDNKLQRLKRVSVESAKQCGRSIAPEILYEDTFEKALFHGENAKNKLFACEFVTENSTPLGKIDGDTAIVVGSEGGFSAEEAQAAADLGYSTVSLGKRILRAETAAIAMTSIVVYLLGELQ